MNTRETPATPGPRTKPAPAATSAAAPSCCGPVEQGACCEPAAKAACCDGSHGNGCGCG